MEHYGLIGSPLGHSLSPFIHKRLFELSGHDADYKLYEIKPDELESNYGFLRGLNGFNITIPHKIAIIPFCGTLDEGAARYGAVNCVKTDGSVGYNTDVYGFKRSIDLLGATLSSEVTLLGCGGVGRMMAIETALSGGKLTIAARSTEKAEKLKGNILAIKPDAVVKVIQLSQFSGNCDLVINSTPLGMFPKNETSPLEKAQLAGVKYLFDAVYNPCETTVMRYAKENGAVVGGGMNMLVLQAAKAHEIWYDAHFDDETLMALSAETERQLS